VGFAWSPAKNKRNVAKHHLAFEEAVQIFDAGYLEKVDDRFDYDEERIMAFGEADGVVITVIYTWRGDDRRIISARRAEPDEAAAYYEVMYGSN